MIIIIISWYQMWCIVITCNYAAHRTVYCSLHFSISTICLCPDEVYFFPYICVGKTIQTIALLAHLACEKGNWGPHLIIVPTSVMLNWELELKKWCPAFKILTYFGTLKERKQKRVVSHCPSVLAVETLAHTIAQKKKRKYCVQSVIENLVYCI